MRTLSVTIGNEDAGKRVETLLVRAFCMSGGWISRLKRRPLGISVNGEKTYTTRVLNEGDVLTAEIGDPPDTPKAAPAAFPLDVLWEDADILIINKPAGITVHADSRRPDEVTLENALAYYLPEGEYAHPVSRLDRGTTGVMTYAKSGYLHERLRRLLHTPDFCREYRGIARGVVTPSAGQITYPIGFDEGSTYKRRAALPGETVLRAVPAVTDYETLDTDGRDTLLRLVPCTGRTHQLRVHMASLGYPLVGDWLYGAGPERGMNRPALHSYSITLRHPMTGKTISVTAPFPPDFSLLVSGVRGMEQL